MWDANGNMILDVADRVTRVMGEFYTGTSPGSFTIPNIGGSPWYIAMTTDPYILPIRMPRIILSGWTLSWSWKYDARNCKIIYGVY